MKAFLSRTTGIICLCGLLLSACSVKQDNKNFEKYLNQDTAVKGKAGVLITALGQPEQYDFPFFDRYLNQIFNAAFPPLLKFIILRDGGTVLRDPKNLFASEEFTPKTLMDCYGKTVSEDGTPYAKLEVKWVKPREEGGAGHFLLKKKNGFVDIAEKTAIKMAASHYPRMPGQKVPYVQQHLSLFKEVESLVSQSFPKTPVQTAWAMYPETVEKAIEALLKEKVETIVVCDLFPVYSNLEQFNALFVEIEHFVHGRAKVIYSPSVGAYASYRKALVKMASDEVSKLPEDSKNLIILTRHGFPEMPGEPFHKLAPAYYDNLQKEVEAAINSKTTDVVYADTEFSGEDDDPEDKRLSSAEALERGLKDKYDNIVFVLVDFMSENTDTVYCAREEALEPIHFEYEGMVPYPDFTHPYRTELTHDKTRIIVAGTPVGPRYQPHVAKGIFDAVATILRGEAWPQLVSGSGKG